MTYEAGVVRKIVAQHSKNALIEFLNRIGAELPERGLRLAGE
jgi:hypothetical protein